MPMQPKEIERLIKERLPDAEVTIEDLAGDGDYDAATVVSAAFKGMTRVQQHQLVDEALRGSVGGELHALALQTKTPETASRVLGGCIFGTRAHVTSSLRRESE